MGDEADQPAQKNLYHTIRPRQSLNSIHHKLHLTSLGVFGAVLWGTVSLTAFVVLAALYLFTYRPNAYRAEPLAYKPQSLFASIPKITSLAGFVQGANDPRAARLEKFLNYWQSPMAGASRTFIEVADQCPMDWTLLPAIAGKESSFGKIIPYNSYNAFGWAVYTGQNSGAVFGSWDDAIRRVGDGLCENYIKQGRDTPEKIETLYTPISAATHGGWRTHVSYFMEEIRNWQ